MASPNTPGSLERLHFGSLSRPNLTPRLDNPPGLRKKGELDQESGSLRARWGEAARPGWGRQVFRGVGTCPGSTPCPHPRPPAPRMQIAALHGPGARNGGPARGRGRRPPPRAAPRRVLTWGVWQSWPRRGLPGRAGAAERATAAATAPAAAPAAAAAGTGGRRPWLPRGPGWGRREGPGGELALAPPGAGW